MSKIYFPGGTLSTSPLISDIKARINTKMYFLGKITCPGSMYFLRRAFPVRT
jgi:hypothetical protein